MPVQFVGYTENSATGDPTSGDWTLPTGWSAVDLGLMWWGTNASTKNVSLPGSVTTVYETSGNGRLFIGYRFLVAGDATFTWTATSVASSVAGWGVAVFRDSPSSGVAPFEALSGTPSSFAGTTNPNPPAATPQSNGAASFTELCFQTAQVGTPTQPSGYAWAGGDIVGGAVAYKLGLPAGASEDPGTWTLDTSSAGIVWTGIIRPWVTGAQPWSSINRPGRV